MNIKLYRRISILIILFSTVINACNASRNADLQATEGTIPQSAPTREGPTIPPMLLITQSSTPSAEISQSPTLWPNPTNTPIFQTSTPVLTVTQKPINVFDLLQENSGCELPCWWGSIPGETKWETAKATFDALGVTPEKYKDSYYYKIEVPGHHSTIDLVNVINNDVVERILIGTRTVINSKIVYNDPNFKKDFKNYLIPNLLGSIGVPNEIWVRTFPGAPEGGMIPYYLLLYYPEKGIIADYNGQAQVEGSNLRICPQDSEINLFLWMPDPSITIQGMLKNNPFLTAEDFSGYRKIDEVTQLSIDKFYEIFSGNMNSQCLMTPISAWTP